MTTSFRSYEEVLAILKKEAADAQKALEFKRGMNDARARDYGSELCPGYMIREEKELEEKVSRAKMKILVLQKVLEKEHDEPSYLRTLEQSAAGHQDKLSELKKSENEEKKELAKLKYELELLREVIGLFAK